MRLFFARVEPTNEAGVGLALGYQSESFPVLVRTLPLGFRGGVWAGASWVHEALRVLLKRLGIDPTSYDREWL